MVNLFAHVVNGNARRIPLPDESVQCVVTSPPYWGLRIYGTQPQIWGMEDCAHEWSNEGKSGQRQRNGASGGIMDDGRKLATPVMLHPSTGSACQRCGAWRGELGLEPTPDLFITHLVEVFREVYRVLRKDGTCWVNMGDCYAGAPNGRKAADTKALGNDDRTFRDKPFSTVSKSKRMERGAGRWGGGNNSAPELKPKDLVGMPWRLAFALQADGWYLRSDVIWHKPNPMPESVEDRPTKSHEYIFLLTKSERYFYDAEAIREPAEFGRREWTGRLLSGQDNGDGHRSSIGTTRGANPESGRNKRTVWTIPTAPYAGAHFATFPPALVEPMVLAGTSPRACEHCGAAWERVVAKEFISTSTRRNHISGNSQPNKDGWEGVERGNNSTETTGWRPRCKCRHNAGAGKCLVLDPFAGTATVGQVCLEYGRSFVGVELKHEYIEFARARLDEIQIGMGI